MGAGNFPTMKTKLSFAGTWLAVAACCLCQNTAQADDHTMAGMKMDAATVAPLANALNSNLDKLFMLHAADGNMTEIMTGKLALQKSKNAGVRHMAQTIIAGHTAAHKDLLKHFKTLGMAPPKKLSPTNQADYDKLKKLRGAAFDKAYVGAQMVAHEATIVLFSHQAHAGKVEVAKMHAMNQLPHIIGHTAVIYDVATKVKAPGAEMRPPAVIEAAKKVHMDMMGQM